MGHPKLLKYGQIRGGGQGFEVRMAASQYIAAASSKFVYRTASATPTVTLMDQTISELLGHVEIQARNSTDGTEIVKCVDDPTAIFRVPILGSGTYATTMRGKTCDVGIRGSIQGAYINSNLLGHLIIVDGDEDNDNWVDVRIRPVGEITRTGVA